MKGFKKRKILRAITVTGLLLILWGGIPSCRVASKTTSVSGAVTNQQVQAVGGAQLWKDIPPSSVKTRQLNRTLPSKFRLLELNRDSLKSILALAPADVPLKTSTCTVKLPLPDGAFQTFRIIETSRMSPALAKKFPLIKSYTGQGLDDVSARVSLDQNPIGFRAMIHSLKGQFFIEPLEPDNPAQQLFICYDKLDLPPPQHPFEKKEEEKHR